jgi:hypothetical protein
MIEDRPMAEFAQDLFGVIRRQSSTTMMRKCVPLGTAARALRSSSRSLHLVEAGMTTVKSDSAARETTGAREPATGNCSRLNRGVLDFAAIPEPRNFRSFLAALLAADKPATASGLG